MSICDKYTKINILQKNESSGVIDRVTSRKASSSHKEKEKELRIYRTEIQVLVGDNKQINISLVKDVLTRKYNFDLREWGYTKMSTFIKNNFNEFFSLTTNKSGIHIINN